MVLYLALSSARCTIPSYAIPVHVVPSGSGSRFFVAYAQVQYTAVLLVVTFTRSFPLPVSFET